MENYLILKFENAGLFRNGKGMKKTKDKVFCVSQKNALDRNKFSEFVEPIVVNHISNMIHVLFGERPKSTNRYSPYDIIQYYYDKALDSYLKIDTYVSDKGFYTSEIVSLNKAVYNSWNPVSYMNWNRVHRLLEDELYNTFIKELSEILGFNVITKTFYDVKNILLKTKDVRLDAIFKTLAENGKSPLYMSIYGISNQESSINANVRTALTVTSSPFKVTRLCGEIIIPVSDEDIVKLKKNKGCATLLDGGLVTIKGIKHANMISVKGFKKMSDISLEKTDI